MKILKWPIIYIVIQTILLFLLAFIYICLGNDSSLFGIFLEQYRFIIVIILGIIFIPLLIKEYKKKKINVSSIKKKSLISIFIFGIAVSIIYNVIFYYLNKVVPISNNFVQSNYIFSTLFAVGIIGPIIEEYMFRGIIYNELKEKYSNMKSILLCTILFSLMHFSIVQFIFTFAFGFILIYVYEKYKTLKAPIILHMASNITSIVMIIIFNNFNFPFHYVLYLISLIIFSVIILFHKRNMI